MRKILASVACLAVVFCAGSLVAQQSGGSGSTGPSEISSGDSGKKDAHDRPIGGATIKLPSASNPSGNPTPPGEPPAHVPAPPTEGEEVPPTETPPAPPPPEDPPTYYGEPVQGKFAFVLDASGSMGGGRIATVRAETVSTVTDLTEEDEFDCVAFGTQFGVGNHYSSFLWEGLLPATEGNKSAAVNWVNGPDLNPGGGTPTYACLQQSCAVYPGNLTKMFLLTDGSPNTSGSAAQILADFPGWWSKFEEATLVAICIGGGGAAQTFMQQLAAIAGGTYVAA